MVLLTLLLIISFNSIPFTLYILIQSYDAILFHAFQKLKYKIWTFSKQSKRPLKNSSLTFTFGHSAIPLMISLTPSANWTGNIKSFVAKESTCSVGRLVDRDVASAIPILQYRNYFTHFTYRHDKKINSKLQHQVSIAIFQIAFFFDEKLYLLI